MSVTLRKRKNADGTISLRLDIYSNGKYCLYRYLAGGIPDKDFGQDGKTVFDLPSEGAAIGLMEIQMDGKILLAGNTDESSTTWPGFYITPPF